MSQRLQELDQLKNSVAGLNQKAAQQEKAALGMSLQSAVQKAPTGPGTATQQAQQLAPQATTKAGQIGLQAQQRSQQQQAQLSQQQIQEKAATLAQSLKQKARKENERIFLAEQASGILITNEELSARKRILKEDLAAKKRIQAAGFYYDSSVQFATWQARHSLAKASHAAKSRFMDQRLAFRREQGQLKLSNEQQLFDFAVSSAKSEQDYRNKAQLIEQASVTKLKALGRAQEVLEQKLRIDASIKAANSKNKFSAEESKLNQQFLRKMQQEDDLWRGQMQTRKSDWLRQEEETADEWERKQKIIHNEWVDKEITLDHEARQNILTQVAAIKEAQRREHERRKNRAQRNAFGGQIVGMGAAVAAVAITGATGGLGAPAAAAVYTGAASAGGSLGQSAGLSMS